MADKFTVKIDKELADLIPNFMEGRKKEIPILEKALKDSDFETLKSIGHKLKGNAPGYGFNLLGTHGAALEIAGRNKRLEDAQKIISQIKDYVAGVQVEFE